MVEDPTMDIDAGAEAGEKEAEAGGKNPLEEPKVHIFAHTEAEAAAVRPKKLL